MNGMEDLVAGVPPVIQDRDALIATIADQQKEIIRLRGLNKTLTTRYNVLERQYDDLTLVDMTMYITRTGAWWRECAKEMPRIGVTVWVQSRGGTNTAAFYDGGTWYTPDHKKVDVVFWQYLPFAVQKTPSMING